jgi:plastocyanin
MRTVYFVTAVLGLGMLSLGEWGCSSDSSTSPYGSYATAPAPAPAPTPAPSNTVLMSGMTFSPATITVAVGTTVTWKNNDGVAHTSTSDTGVWDTGNIAAGASTTTTFNTAGTFPYNCVYHASMGMRGTVIVQ